jgi:hypothetical protein
LKWWAFVKDNLDKNLKKGWGVGGSPPTKNIITAIHCQTQHIIKNLLSYLSLSLLRGIKSNQIIILKV